MKSLSVVQLPPSWPALATSARLAPCDCRRKAVQSYSEEEDSLLENLKHGILLGDDRMAAGLRETLGGAPDPDRPQTRQLLTTKSIEELVGEIASTIGLPSEEVEELRKPIRRRRRPMRDVLIYLVWRNSHQAQQVIADYFHVTYTALPAARTRGAAYLKQKPKLRAAAKGRFMI
ncbi:MAG: hypothetical protein QF886_01065 [Planctomycetota bacterium]|jgi:hypothetical protein|nr:hypothetical protein [Planctomycetota bacterium]